MKGMPHFRQYPMGDVENINVEPGEYVVRRNAVNALGVDNMELLNHADGAHGNLNKLMVSADLQNKLVQDNAPVKSDVNGYPIADSPVRQRVDATRQMQGGGPVEEEQAMIPAGENIFGQPTEAMTQSQMSNMLLDMMTSGGVGGTLKLLGKGAKKLSGKSLKKKLIREIDESGLPDSYGEPMSYFKDMHTDDLAGILKNYYGKELYQANRGLYGVLKKGGYLGKLEYLDELEYLRPYQVKGLNPRPKTTMKDWSKEFQDISESAAVRGRPQTEKAKLTAIELRDKINKSYNELKRTNPYWDRKPDFQEGGPVEEGGGWDERIRNFMQSRGEEPASEVDFSGDVPYPEGSDWGAMNREWLSRRGEGDLASESETMPHGMSKLIKVMSKTHPAIQMGKQILSGEVADYRLPIGEFAKTAGGYQGGGLIDKFKQSFVDDKGLFRGERGEPRGGWTSGRYRPLQYETETVFEGSKPLNFEGEKSQFHGLLGRLADRRLRKDIEGVATDFRREYDPQGEGPYYANVEYGEGQDPSLKLGYDMRYQPLGERGRGGVKRAERDDVYEKEYMGILDRSRRRGVDRAERNIVGQTWEDFYEDEGMTGEPESSDWVKRAESAYQRRADAPSNIFQLIRGLGKEKGAQAEGYKQGGEVRDKPSGNWGQPGAYNEALEAQRSIETLDRTQEEAEETLRLKRLNHEIKSYERDRGMKPFDSYSGEEVEKHMYDIMPYFRSFGRLKTPAQKKDLWLYQRLGVNPDSLPPQLKGLAGRVLLQRYGGEQQ